MNDDDYTMFPTGTEIYANKGIVGIDADLDTFQGYDGSIRIYDYFQEKFDLTKADREALADMMIVRWIAFRALPDSHFKKAFEALKASEENDK